MSEILEQQAEEREALQSIYEGDAAFKEIDLTTYQYKYGEENSYKSLLIEIKWGENYPAVVPTINMDTFYNQHLIPPVKEKIQSVLLEEAEQWLGCGMTYTLFECIKDRLDELTADQPEHTNSASLDCDGINSGVGAIKISDSNGDAAKKKEPRKEQLTKAQKRRQWERTDHKGDHPRGWDWIDVVKHLSQTGNKESIAPSTSGAVPVVQTVNS